jgi:hypothetical protein
VRENDYFGDLRPDIDSCQFHTDGDILYFAFALIINAIVKVKILKYFMIN